jgi:hypothetical protein
MKILSIVCTLVLLLTEAPSVFSQREDFHWLLGYQLFKPTLDTSYGRCELIFTDTTLKIAKTQNVINKFDFTNASISDSSGYLLFYTNGLEVYDRNYQVMPNGDDLNPGEFATGHEEDGYPLQGGALILNWPGHSGKYFIIHHTIDRIPYVWYALNMLTTLVDVTLNNGYGDVVYKNKSVYADSLGLGSLTACRHANGRDWWLVIFNYRGGKCYKFLLDYNGIHLDHIQSIPFSFYPSGLGNSVFSPDGTKFSFIHFTSQYNREFILAQFDRCNGLLSNIQYDSIPDYDFSGVAFSPNSKYLYVSTGLLLYQLDMADTFPFDTKIKIDTIDGFLSIPRFPSYLTFMQLAPDGKIYICNGRSPQHLSTIEQPDLRGKACDLRQHNILIIHNSTIPNFPNFRLGALEGSTCDTLAHGRLPVADWTSKQDTLDHLQFNFIDHSLYEVRDWFWDFGDPSSSDNHSNLQYPSHVFSKDGVHNVCLIVKNKIGADTLCRIINIEIVSSDDQNLNKISAIILSPNPCKNNLNISVINYNSANMSFQLYNSLGEKVKSKWIIKGINIINTEDLQSGIYFISILEKGIVIKIEKLLKI